MPHRLYPQIADRAGHRCEYCRAPEAHQTMELEVEHIRPRAHGGDDDPDNLALACASCNRRKSQATRANDPVTGLMVLLFNPRRDVWTEHFMFNAETREIVGRTPTGRATAIRLDLNRTQLIVARLLWSASGWLPP